MDKKDIKEITPIKWTWYLYLFANVLLIVGVGIAWGILGSSGVLNLWYVPIIVCDLVSVLATSVFYYFESRELFYLKAHVPKKCFYYYLSSSVFFLLAVLITIFLTGANNKLTKLSGSIALPMGLMFGLSAFFSLVGIGLYRYGKFRIELAIYKRRHGEMLIKQESVNKQKNDLQNLSEEEIKRKRDAVDDYSSVTTPTSNLINNVDKEQKN